MSIEIRFCNNMKNIVTTALFSLTMCVFGADGDGVKTVSVMEGDSVTFNNSLGEFNQIKLRLVDSVSIIAETDRNNISYINKKFEGRLNHQTGSLTINNTRITDSGVYHLEINGTSTVTFSVTVYVFGADGDGVKRESVMEGDSVTLDTGLREKFNLIKWRFGDSGSIIAETDSNKISYPLNDTERFRDRLKMNNQTGSLIINNTRITDSGVYHLRIDHNDGTATVRFNVTVCGSCVTESSVTVPGLSPCAVTGIVLAVLLVFAVVALAVALGCVFYYRHKIFKQERQHHSTGN